MNVIETKIEGLLILEPRVFGDDRGWFMESFPSHSRVVCFVWHTINWKYKHK